MKVNQFSEKLGMIDSDLIEEAATAGNTEIRKRPAKKTVITVLVAAILIMASFSTALAVNDNFRDAVISFFRLGTPETVPKSGNVNHKSNIAIISSSDVDGLVNINYLKLNGDYEYNDGVIFTYNETDGYDNGAYFRVENNKLIPVKTKRAETSFDCRGYTWSIRFDYAVINGKLYVHNIPDDRIPEVKNADAIFGYASSMKAGGTQKVLLRLPFLHSNLRSYSEYAVEMDIRTGKITDFLGKCGLENMTDFVHEISLADDLSKAVITCFDKDYNGYTSFYYCDIKGNKLMPIQNVTGEDVSDAWLLDDETLFYYTKDSFDGWRLNLSTGVKQSAYRGLKAYTDENGGVQFLGGKYALLIDAGRKVRLMDLSTGTQSLIDGLSFTTFTGAYLNDDHTKIYFERYGEDDLEIGNLGVLDIPKNKLIMMDRKGQEIRRECDIGWFDNNRIVIDAAEENKDRYLYLYEFKN